MESALDLSGVLGLLGQSGTTVLLPSHAAVEALQTQFDRQQRTRGLGAWEPAPLLAWDRWLASLWDALTLEGLETRAVLNRLQEESLWARLAPLAGVQAASGAVARDLARQASSALALASAFKAVDRLEASADSSDARIFAGWQKIFAGQCRREHLISEASRIHALIAHVAASRVPVPAHLHLVGFNQLSPAQNALLRALRLAGTAVHRHTLRSDSSHVLQGKGIVEGDPETELRWGVRWMRQFLTERNDGHLPVQTAILLPDPDGERALLEPILREYLAPELQAITADLSSTPWRYNSGPPLARVPMIAQAFHLLRWLGEELPTEMIGTLLLSPYLGHTDEFEARARFEMHVLRKGNLLRPEMGLQSFLRWAAVEPRKTRNAASVLALPEWHNLHTLARRNTRSISTYGEWTESIRQVLKVAGWPGTRALSPSEFRANEAWDGVLDLLATLDLHGDRVSFSDLLERLSEQLQQVTLQPSSARAVVHILRPSEAEGRLFDATLVLHGTDNHWPAPESSHPFLGWTLQRSLGMPGADPAATQERNLRTLRSIRDRSTSFLLVSAAGDANGPLRLTRLADELSCPDICQEDLLVPERFTEFAPAYELIPDDNPMPPLPSAHVAGGARVLELQANCGFRAFATLRLGSEAPESRSLGFHPREAGQDLHRALEIFWSTHQARAVVEALSETERRQAVSSAVCQALDAHRSGSAAADAWTEAYLQIAEQRLTSLLMRWLEEELKRGDFTVHTQEKKTLIAIGPLELNVRPDRIDAVEGGLVFVDYKTSLNLSTEDWLGDRPSAPQLPLYALLADSEQVRGIAFGRLRAGETMGWISLQAEEGIFPTRGGTLSADLQGQLLEWQTELARLATDFAKGAASVDPKSYPHTCQHCQQRLICRLDPISLLASAAPETGFREEMEDDAGL